jgi:hypothetical protein
MDHKISSPIVKILACLSLFIIITLTAIIPQAQAGQLYHWKDKDGNVYLSDTPPDSSAHQGEVKSTFAPEETATATDRKTAATQPHAVRQKDVTIYTNTT